MIGAALREVGVLAFVFIPLDNALSEHPVLPWWGVVLAMLVYGVGIWFVGVLIEEMRQ